MPEAEDQKLRILVVDDEAAVCDCIRRLLAYDGHQVQGCTSSTGALAAFDTGKFDLVFMDYSMPGMKGDQLALAISVREPSLPIVMVSGNAPAFGTVPGVAFILNKPVMLDDLRRAIARVQRGDFRMHATEMATSRPFH
jgi:CheY-like chemotaxis protein